MVNQFENKHKHNKEIITTGYCFRAQIVEEQKDNKFFLAIPLPGGITHDSIEVSFLDNIMRVKSVKKISNMKEEIKSEQSESKKEIIGSAAKRLLPYIRPRFNFEIEYPCEIEPETAKVEFEEGVLFVYVEKSKRAIPYVVPVNHHEMQETEN